MVNPTLHVNNVIKEQVKKCMNKTFDTNALPAIKSVLKKDTSVLVLVMCYNTRHEIETKYFIVLSCVIYDIIENDF